MNLMIEIKLDHELYERFLMNMSQLMSLVVFILYIYIYIYIFVCVDDVYFSYVRKDSFYINHIYLLKLKCKTKKF